jgi:hypothetical protein
VITPSALNVLIIGASVIIFAAFWRWAAGQMADNAAGQAMAAIL